MKKKHFNTAVILAVFLAAGIQPAFAVINIPADTSVGTWDESNLLYTLTTDVSDTIILTNPNWLDGMSEEQAEAIRLTFDGGGHTVELGTLDYGVAFGLKRGYITIQNLNITDCGNGIDINTATRINVINTNISSCQYGITIGLAGTCIIGDNTISDCSEYGIWLSGAVNNKIYNNNFISNNNQATVSGGSGNVFDDLSGSGNYWSDWCLPDHPDADGDGIVDSPYIIVDDEDPLLIIQDEFPWVIPNGWSNQDPIADAGPDQTVEQDSPAGASVTLDGSDSSDDGPLTYAWTWAYGGSSTGVNPTVTLPLGTTTVTLTVNDGILSDTDTVDITVQQVEAPADVLEDIIDYIVEDMYVPEGAEKEIGKAVKELEKAIKEFNKDKIDKAIKKIEKAVKRLEKAQKKGADTQAVIDKLVDLVQGL